MRSECWTREMKIFRPRTTYRSPRRSAEVEIRVVSRPASGSVTANAWSRTSPEAMAGRYRRFCSSLAWRTRAPIMYTWAWQGWALPPDRFTSSRTNPASRTPSPPPPYSRGIMIDSQPASVIARTNSSG